MGGDKDVDIFATDHLMDDLKGRSVRGGVYVLVAQGIKLFLQMGSTMILARLLTPADFGLVAVVTAITGFVGMFKDAGLSAATIQRDHINHAQVSALFWINLVLSFFLMLIVIVIAPVVTWLYDEPRLLFVTIALAGTFIFGGLTVQHNALLRRQMRFKDLAAIEVISLAVGAVTAVIMAWQGCGYWALVGMTAGVVIVNCILAWALTEWRPGKPRRGSGVRTMLIFGGHLTTFSFVNYFSRNADNLLIGWYWGSAALGLYSKAYGLLTQPVRQFDQVVSTIMLPLLSRLYVDKERYGRSLKKMQRISVSLSMPLLVASAFYADVLISLLLGAQWVDSIPIFRILAVVAIIQVVARFTGWVFVSSGETAAMVKYGAIGSLLTVVSFVVGLPWGPIGVANAYLVQNLIFAPVLMLAAIRIAGITLDEFLGTLKMPILSGTATLFSAVLLAKVEPAGGIHILTIGLAPALGFAVLLVPKWNREELAELVRAYRRKTK